MPVSLDQLEAFVTAADTGSFSAAARKLKKAQSAVSSLISSLEDDLGISLFSRATRVPSLTDAGNRLLPEARLLIDRRQHLIGVARSFEERVETRLVVAIDELYPETEIGSLFGNFAAQFPHVELELLFPHTDAIPSLLLDGKADLGVMWRKEDLAAELDFHTVGWVSMLLVCGRDHPLSRGSVSWDDLRQHRQIMFSKRREGAEKHSLRVAAEVWRVESHWVMLQILQNGIGWAFIPDHILAHSPLALTLVTPSLKFDEGKQPIALELIWHKQRPAGAASKWLKENFAITRVQSSSLHAQGRIARHR